MERHPMAEESSFSRITSLMEAELLRTLPRMLTQTCRDATNPAFGCFDRNWWHYRMRDFPSIILQQGGYAVLQASTCFPASTIVPQTFAQNIAAGACRFWNMRAVRHGAFEEYYPWEKGYPPLAFSTLSVAKTAASGIIAPEELKQGLQIAAKQLQTRFEPKAANQQVAGLAALAWVRKIFPEFVDEQVFLQQQKRTLALQTEEGWFWEYDGPDLGYLSVTIDCLFDLLDATGEAVYSGAAAKALDFIFQTVCSTRVGLGMLNARNTDYIVPYGIARFAVEGNTEQRGKAARLIQDLYGSMDQEWHFFRSIDDRYWCHYIGHSVARAIPYLRQLKDAPPPLATRPLQPDSEAEISFPLAGYVFRSIPGVGILTLALKKGGCARLTGFDGKPDSISDWGWQYQFKKRVFVSHWWSKDWTIRTSTPGTWEISGTMREHKEQTSTPWMHMALRFLSFLLGEKLISILKNVMIFKKSNSPVRFKRTIRITEKGFETDDELISAIGINPAPLAAPRASKRHVASADSFHPGDCPQTESFTVERAQPERKDDVIYLHSAFVRKPERA